MERLDLKEDLLHFAWKHRLLGAELTLCDGSTARIIHPGSHNQLAGPDFLGAQIRIGEALYSGHVEIHIYSRDWDAHGHTSDPNYQNVILHLVYQYNGGGPDVPTAEVANALPTDLLQRYTALQPHDGLPPCHALLPLPKDWPLKLWLGRLTIERLESRHLKIIAINKKNLGDWSETLWQMVARSFGFGSNADAMEALANAIPNRVLGWHKRVPSQMEALLFGAANSLDGEPADEYSQGLKAEWRFLSQKYSLSPSKIPFNWGRVRPHNQPHVRLAQLAAVVAASQNMLGYLVDAAELHTIAQGLQAEASAYWQNHSRLGKSGQGYPSLSKSAVDSVLINAIIPLLYAYGRKEKRDELTEKAMDWMEQLPAEENSIIKTWRSLKIKAENAAESQALLLLKKTYCDQFRCLDCAIGTRLLRDSTNKSGFETVI